MTEKDILINNLQKELSEYKFTDTQTYKEISILFPDIKDVSIGNHLIFPGTDSAKIETVVLYQLKNKDTKVDLSKMRQWLKEKLSADSIVIVKQ